MKTRLLEDIDKDRYEAFLNRVPTALPQHTWAWREAILEVGQDEAYYLGIYDGKDLICALPAFIYRHPLGNLLISSPQAGSYGGILYVDGADKKEIFRVAIEAFLGVACENDCSLATIVTPPFADEADIELYRTFLKPDFERENFYQFLDLRSDFVIDREGKLKGTFRENIRRNIKKGVQNSLEIISEDDCDFFVRWLEIHQNRMVQIGAHPLPQKLFLGIREFLLPRGKAKVLYVLLDRKLIAGGFFLCHNQTVDYFMANANATFVKLQPNSFLFYHAILWAKKAGFRYFNWESSPSRQSSLYHYKKGWGSKEGVHFYLTKVVGDISRLREGPVELIKDEFRWHYVMPYSEFSATNVSERKTKNR